MKQFFINYEFLPFFVFLLLILLVFYCTKKIQGEKIHFSFSWENFKARTPTAIKAFNTMLAALAAGFTAFYPYLQKYDKLCAGFALAGILSFVIGSFFKNGNNK